jgi:hypothetical protein
MAIAANQINLCCKRIAGTQYYSGDYNKFFHDSLSFLIFKGSIKSTSPSAVS